jgi:hypothetical protein
VKEKSGHLYLLTGLIIGALIGVLIAFLLPAHFTDTDPSLLQSADKDLYRSLIARAYLVEADNERAQARLDLLDDVSSEDALVAQAQQLLAAGGNEAESRALALLAAGLHQGAVRITPLPGFHNEPTIEQRTDANGIDETAGAPTQPVTRTQGPTITPRPTNTPLPTEGAPYELVEQNEVCDVDLPGSLIQVYVYNRTDNPVAGVRIEISITNGGMETFYTGLYPEISAGYADYLMAEGMSYNLRVGQAGQLLQNLSIPRCEDEDGNPFQGSIELIFKKPD